MSIDSKASNTDKLSDVKIFPPLAGFVIIIIGLILQSQFPLNLFSNKILSVLIGLPALIIGLVFQVSIIRTLKKAKTTPLYKKPTTAVLQKGLFAKSRNPMFLSIFLWNIGLAFIFNTYWLLLLTIVLYLFVRYYVVSREEVYLERLFGEEYRKYMSKVPRWL